MTPPPTRPLFLFAHPDDELAVAARLRRWQALGVGVSCAWAHSNAIREAESRRTMGAIGITDLHFGCSPDGDFVDDLAALESWVQKVVRQVQPDWVAVTAYEQGHLDHDALNWACRGLDSPVHEYPVYHHYGRLFQHVHVFSQSDLVEELPLSAEESAWKRGLLQNYPSQSVARNVWLAELWARLARRPIDLFHTERLRPRPNHDYGLPSHPEPTRRRIERCKEWRRWLRAIREQVG